MICTKGPVPLLVLAILFSIALFFAYKEISALRLRLAKLEADVPVKIEEALASLSPQQSPAPLGNTEYADFAHFGDIQGELREYAEEAAAAMEMDGGTDNDVADVGRWELDGDTKNLPVLEDITEEVDVPEGEEESVPVASAKKRSKKNA